MRASSTTELLTVEPQAYLNDVISRIVAGHPNSCIDDLMPWAYPGGRPHPVG